MTTTMTAKSIEALARPDYGDFDEKAPLWSKVLPGLYQGGTALGDELVQKRQAMITPKEFDTVITLYAWANPVGWGVKELRYGFFDAGENAFDTGELFEVVEFAHAEWKAGKRVLIRCQAGWNRSGLVMALVLMREGYSAEEAIALIRERRSPNALKNGAFVDFLFSQGRTNLVGEQEPKPRKRAGLRPRKRA